MLPLNGSYNLLTRWTCWFFIITHIVDDVFIFWNQNQTFTFTFVFHYTTSTDIYFYYQSSFFAFTELHCWTTALIEWNKMKLSNSGHYINSSSQTTHHLKFFIFLMLHRSKHWFIWFKNSFDKNFNKTLFTISWNYLCQTFKQMDFFHVLSLLAALAMISIIHLYIFFFIIFFVMICLYLLMLTWSHCKFM